MGREEKENRTTIQRIRKFIGPIIEREFEWAVKKWESLKGGKCEPMIRVKGRHRLEATEKALFISLNSWLGDPILMEEIGDTQTKSTEFEEEQWEVANIRSLLTGVDTHIRNFKQLPIG